jgi:hypothetical protein
MRAVLADYRHGLIDERLARRRLVAAGIAGAPAEAMVRAFKPTAKANGGTKP